MEPILRTTITVTVFSRDGDDPKNMRLEDIGREMAEGDMIGDWMITEQTLLRDPAIIVDALTSVGDPNFFNQE